MDDYTDYTTSYHLTTMAHIRNPLHQERVMRKEPISICDFSVYGGFLSHGGTPKFHPFETMVFHYKPCILGYPHFRNPPTWSLHAFTLFEWLMMGLYKLLGREHQACPIQVPRFTSETSQQRCWCFVPVIFAEADLEALFQRLPSAPMNILTVKKGWALKDHRTEDGQSQMLSIL
jgi:hypothetical protein